MIGKHNKLVFLGLSFFLLLVMILPCACTQNSISGLYMAEDQEKYPGYYINFLDDNTWEMMGYTGTWQKSGEQVIVTSILGAEPYQIDGDKLITPSGVVLVKK